MTTEAEVASQRSKTTRGGRDARLRSLVEQYFDFVWRSLRRLGVPPENVDDVSQHVWILIAGKIDEILPGHERSYVFGVAMRVAANARRARARAREIACEVDEPPDSRPLADVLIDRARARAVFDDVLDEMQPDLRAVFVLFEVEEMTVPEIASLLEIPGGTVSSRLRRAREIFHEKVARLRARERRGGTS